MTFKTAAELAVNKFLELVSFSGHPRHLPGWYNSGVKEILAKNSSVCKNRFSLAIFDSLYLVYYVVDYGIIGTFMRANEEKSEPYWYRVTYPFLLWPLKWMFMSCTIFMVINSHHFHFILHICLLIIISNSLPLPVIQ